MKLNFKTSNKKITVTNQFKTKKCVCCGEKLTRLNFNDWGYYFKKEFCCSYHCMREMERRNKKDDKKLPIQYTR